MHVYMYNMSKYLYSKRHHCIRHTYSRKTKESLRKSQERRDPGPNTRITGLNKSCGRASHNTPIHTTIPLITMRQKLKTLQKHILQQLAKLLAYYYRYF